MREGMRVKGRVVAFALALGLTGAALAQDEAARPVAARPVAAAPVWKVGMSWQVEVFSPDLDAEVTGRVKPKLPELPGYPPLNHGVPEGYKRAGTFKVSVVSQAATLSARAEGEDGPAEAYWELRFEALGGKGRTARALYAVSDLSLGEVEYDLGGDKKTRITREGTATLGCSANASFGFPFDWPDLVAARDARAELRDGRRSLVQETEKVGESGLKVVLVEKEAKLPSPATFQFEAKLPWWTLYEGPGLIAKLKVEKK